jgi:DNA-binding NtrC family response regulator
VLTRSAQARRRIWREVFVGAWRIACSRVGRDAGGKHLRVSATMPSSPPKNPQLSVTLVAKNASTLEGLENYLRGVGVWANSTRSIERLLEMTPPSSAAVIVFPDEFQAAAVASVLATAKKQRPDVLVVVITNEPSRFDKLAGGVGASEGLLVMAKPVWAWTILDAIRARLDEPQGLVKGAPRKEQTS